MPKLRACSSARVITLSSRAHMRHPDAIDYTRLKNESAATYLSHPLGITLFGCEFNGANRYDGWHAYGRSKLSNILMTKVCARCAYLPHNSKITSRSQYTAHTSRSGRPSPPASPCRPLELAFHSTPCTRDSSTRVTTSCMLLAACCRRSSAESYHFYTHFSPSHSPAFL